MGRDASKKQQSPCETALHRVKPNAVQNRAEARRPQMLQRHPPASQNLALFKETSTHRNIKTRTSRTFTTNGARPRTLNSESLKKAKETLHQIKPRPKLGAGGACPETRPGFRELGEATPIPRMPVDDSRTRKQALLQESLSSLGDCLDMIQREKKQKAASSLSQLCLQRCKGM